MNEAEQLTAIPKLQDEGNQLYMEKKYEEAELKYTEALGILEQLLIR